MFDLCRNTVMTRIKVAKSMENIKYSLGRDFSKMQQCVIRARINEFSNKHK